MSKTYKLIFWGPGNIGGTVLKQALARPEFEVVGVKVWNPEKEGVDAWFGQPVRDGGTPTRANRDTNRSRRRTTSSRDHRANPTVRADTSGPYARCASLCISPWRW